MERPLYHHIWSDLSQEKRMIFLAGPRQAGKTTLAKMVSATFRNAAYFNWDLVTSKRLLIEQPTFFEHMQRADNSTPLVVFDEIHKYKPWKNYLKGVYDEFSATYQFLVLGSGRLNLFQKGGDSLAGRYFMFTLWPLTLAELAQRRRPFTDYIAAPLHLEGVGVSVEQAWDALARLGGFPEPFLSGKDTFYRKWSSSYGQQLIREDIHNMTAIKDVGSMEILFSLLPSRIGSPLSMSSLARDVQVSFNSIRRWVEIFESFFLVFRLPAWGNKIARALTKEQKLYLYDYAHIAAMPARFENMVALELWRAVANWNDLGLGDFGLYYVRTKEKEEVDFLLTRERVPWLLIEAKLSDDTPAKSLLKFQSLLHVPAVQLVNRPGVCKLLSNGAQRCLIVTASRWLSTLP